MIKKQTYLGNKAWKHPELKIEEVDTPYFERGTKISNSINKKLITVTIGHVWRKQKFG